MLHKPSAIIDDVLRKESGCATELDHTEVALFELPRAFFVRESFRSGLPIVTSVGRGLLQTRLPNVFHQSLGRDDKDLTMNKEANVSPVTASLDLPVSGMNCAACSARIEKLLNALPGAIRN